MASLVAIDKYPTKVLINIYKLKDRANEHEAKVGCPSKKSRNFESFPDIFLELCWSVKLFLLNFPFFLLSLIDVRYATWSKRSPCHLWLPLLYPQAFPTINICITYPVLVSVFEGPELTYFSHTD